MSPSPNQNIGFQSPVIFKTECEVSTLLELSSVMAARRVLHSCGAIVSPTGSENKVPRKIGTAPMGHMERQLQAALQARQGKRDETM